MPGQYPPIEPYDSGMLDVGDHHQLIRDAAILNGIPGVLIHGRYDVSSPLDTAWRLSKAWTTSRRHVLDDSGHGGGETFLPLVVGALNEFARL